MTFQMYLLEQEMEAEERGRAEERESVAIKLIHRGRPLEEIHEDTGVPVQRLKELANNNRDDL